MSRWWVVDGWWVGGGWRRTADSGGVRPRVTYSSVNDTCKSNSPMDIQLFHHGHRAPIARGGGSREAAGGRDRARQHQQSPQREHSHGHGPRPSRPSPATRHLGACDHSHRVARCSLRFCSSSSSRCPARIMHHEHRRRDRHEMHVRWSQTWHLVNRRPALRTSYIQGHGSGERAETGAAASAAGRDTWG